MPVPLQQKKIPSSTSFFMMAVEASIPDFTQGYHSQILKRRKA
jgi:hypothetical protein